MKFFILLLASVFVLSLSSCEEPPCEPPPCPNLLSVANFHIMTVLTDENGEVFPITENELEITYTLENAPFDPSDLWSSPLVRIGIQNNTLSIQGIVYSSFQFDLQSQYGNPIGFQFFVRDLNEGDRCSCSRYILSQIFIDGEEIYNEESDFDFRFDVHPIVIRS